MMNMNPQQMVIQMMQRMGGNNPALQNMINLAKQGKTQEVENVARNMMGNQNYENAVNQFKKNFGNKFLF